MPDTIEKVRALGTKEALEAASGMEIIMMQEKYHSDILNKLIARHEAQKTAAEAGKSCPIKKAIEEMKKKEDKKTDSQEKVYICTVCGYEHIGSLDDEPDDYVCPICHKGKEVFKEK